MKSSRGNRYGVENADIGSCTRAGEDEKPRLIISKQAYTTTPYHRWLVQDKNAYGWLHVLGVPDAFQRKFELGFNQGNWSHVRVLPLPNKSTSPNALGSEPKMHKAGHDKTIQNRLRNALDTQSLVLLSPSSDCAVLVVHTLQKRHGLQRPLTSRS